VAGHRIEDGVSHDATWWEAACQCFRTVGTVVRTIRGVQQAGEATGYGLDFRVERAANSGSVFADNTVAAKKPNTKSLDGLNAYDGATLTVVIETPKGSQNKYTYEPKYGTFVLSGVLPAGAVFPFDFGFVPSTLGGDGDPLDILVLMDASAFAGCIVPSRLIGAIQAEQTEKGKTERNDRLLAVAANSITHKSIRNLTDVSEDLLDQIEHFFVSYNQAKGKRFVPKGRCGPDRAGRLIAEGIARATKRSSRRKSTKSHR
jgi:inorganic pyrophosphatase